MRLFPSPRDADAAEPDDTINLLWQYEISDDGGKSWRPEVDPDARHPDVLRRGNWVTPALN